MISTSVSQNPIVSVSRYDKAKKMTIEVPCPAVVKAYNSGMGGVDLLDSLTALFKSKLKTRRWYMYIFFHSLNMMTVTAWLLYKRDVELTAGQRHMPLSDFHAQIATTLIKMEKKKGRPSNESCLMPSPQGPQRSGLQARGKPKPLTDVRFDGVGHWPKYGARLRCKEEGCNKKTHVYCQKCQMNLCLLKERNCFSTFHKV